MQRNELPRIDRHCSPELQPFIPMGPLGRHPKQSSGPVLVVLAQNSPLSQPFIPGAPPGLQTRHEPTGAVANVLAVTHRESRSTVPQAASGVGMMSVLQPTQVAVSEQIGVAPEQSPLSLHAPHRPLRWQNSVVGPRLWQNVSRVEGVPIAVHGAHLLSAGLQYLPTMLVAHWVSLMHSTQRSGATKTGVGATQSVGPAGPLTQAPARGPVVAQVSPAAQSAGVQARQL